MRTASISGLDFVVKLGGNLMSRPQHFTTAVSAIRQLARDCRLLVVPGGGAFADAVRDLDRLLGLSEDEAHRLAVLAMDQSAELVARRLRGGVIVTSPDEIVNVLNEGHVPVLAPSRWLTDVDPLPHSWDATSDSIAAWVAGQVGSTHLVLIKPPGTGVHRSVDSAVSGLPLVDSWFPRALPEGLEWTMVAADQVVDVFRELPQAIRCA